MKTKWLKARFPISYNDIHRSLVSAFYNDKDGSGFEVVAYESDYIEAKYIERMVISESIVDPFGNETEVNTTRYMGFCFQLIRVGNDEFLIKVIAPPRGLKSFIDSLYKCIGFGFFVAAINLNLHKLQSAFEEALNFTSSKTTKIIASGLSLSKQATAKIEIKSNNDALKSLDDNFQQKAYSLDKIRIEGGRSSENNYIEASKAGVVVFSDNIDVHINGIIKRIAGI